jgi:enoyl-CoA hydratase/carnithine racemase
MIQLEKRDSIFILTMDDGENRWNTTFDREISTALDKVEASIGPAALVTTSSDPKFFSNGLDLKWRASSGDHPGGDKAAFGSEFMALMGRIITLPLPSICAINGHAFGAGFMMALCHDVRLMRQDRGFICANEVEIGMVIPDPELALFQHKLPANVFFETVQLARRWTGPEAAQAGIISSTCSQEDLLESAVSKAQSLARLGENRKVYGKMKERLFGSNAAINTPHGAAHLLRSVGPAAS